MSRNRAMHEMLHKSPRVDRYGRLLEISEFGTWEVGRRIYPARSRFLTWLMAWWRGSQVA